MGGLIGVLTSDASGMGLLYEILLILAETDRKGNFVFAGII